MASKNDLKHLKKLLPKRTKLSNKTDSGKVLIIGGGTGLYGAGILAALAATKSGAGYTHLMTDLAKFPWIKYPDFIIHPLKMSELKNKTEFAIGIGPGLGIKAANLKIIKYLIKNNFNKVVVDADALTIIAENNLAPLPASWILTPHEGELARLLKTKSSLIKNNREKYLKLAEKKFQCTILLKGANTLVANYVCNSGTPALGKAGTGDVLLGMITALLAQGLAPVDAARLGAHLHGLCAKAWEEKGQDQLSLRPTDLLNLLPNVLFKFRKS